MSYTRVNWENLPSTNTPVNATNLNKMDAGIANAVEKTGDTLTGGLLFENKDEYDAIRKKRTIDGTDYEITVGLGGNKSSRMELVGANNTVLSSVEARSDGIYNGVTGKKLAEQESSKVNITANTGTLAANTSYKIGNIVGLNAKFTGVTASSGATTVLCTLPSKYYNTSTEMEIIIFLSNGTVVPSWIRTNGQVVIAPLSNLSNSELKMVTSFII